MPGMPGGGPMEFSKSSAKIQLTPDTGNFILPQQRAGIVVAIITMIRGGGDGVGGGGSSQWFIAYGSRICK